MSEKCGVHLLCGNTQLYPYEYSHSKGPNIYTPSPTLPESVPSHPSPIVVTRPRTLIALQLTLQLTHLPLSFSASLILTLLHTLTHTLSISNPLAKEAQVVAGQYLGFLVSPSVPRFLPAFFTILLVSVHSSLIRLIPPRRSHRYLSLNPPIDAASLCDERNTWVGNLWPLHRRIPDEPTCLEPDATTKQPSTLAADPPCFARYVTVTRFAH
ncbi:hypothetical protein BDP55DRAFT_674829 [Colletotrichum godetiae]|uniref:Uncharacterized protein n=1 Tax=Colletotrichum godetiae TaxID=1209918 RepID=A0AAJ0AD91_9PEZI|nr:uncharacterized protein BDP55DRAFT_674829 [Colletotrichum godetiae]KAK1671786.1 hypothetical protein BDP55DRAFT_674829 [Colletotrichum godetiae]